MQLWHKLARVVISDDPRLHRLLGYWTATGVLYLICIGVLWMQIDGGTAIRAAGLALTWFAFGGLAVFYVLLRASARLRIKPWKLSFAQALFAALCNALAYAATGPMRGAALIVLPMVVVFCTFSLRPRQSLLLSALALLGVGATMVWMNLHEPLLYPARIEAMHFALVTVSLLAVTVLTGEMSKLRTRLKEQKEELLAALATIRKLATIDELTSLANRRHMNEVLQAQERRDGTDGQPFCIALLDIDFFKSVNDRLGHAAGDTVLRTFAAAARTELRGADVLARWGGEEFLLMLPDTGLEEAMAVLKRMAERVGEMCVPELEIALRITFSAGIVAHCASEPFADTITRADKAMYVAKSTGRDRIVAG
ncbi:MAG: diguanylate cyclase [Pseudomonadota bacterium]